MKACLEQVRVHAHPFTYGYRKLEEPWKEAIACEVAKHWDAPPLHDKKVRLALKFLLARDYDLTGLLESTVNAIAFVVFLPERRGPRTKWNHQDNWVFEIVASKELGHEADPGVVITLEEL